MRRLLAALAALACTVGLSASAAPPAAADTVKVGGSPWSVALTFPDMQWSSRSCQFLPVTAVVTGDVQAWTFGGFVTATSDEDEEGGYNWYIDYDDMVTEGAGPFTFRHAVLLCPGSDPSGAYEVVGEVGARLASSPAEWMWLPYRATFDVSGIPTVTTLDVIEMAAGEATFIGRMSPSQQMPSTFTGCQTWLTVETEVDSEWVYVTEGSTESDGSFAVTTTSSRLVGTRYRVSSGSSSICAASTSTPKALSVKLPRVRLTTVSRDSKLRINVDPNLGRRSWAFQVQREDCREECVWRNAGSYRTRGSRETRTINKKQGCYRIRVLAQRGYAEYLSDSVCLSR